MNRLLVVGAAAIAGVAIWRRREIRSDAERASQAIAGAAGSARERIQRHPDDGEGGDGDAGEAESTATGGGDEAERSDAAEPTPRIS